MKILLVHNFSTHKNGEDIYVESLIKLLQRNNHETYLYSKNNKELENKLFENMTIARNMFVSNDTITDLSKLIEKKRPDLAHIHNVFPLISPDAYRVCKSFGLPVIQTIHNYRFMCSKSVLFRNGKVCELCVRKNFLYPSIIFGCYHHSYYASALFAPTFYYHKKFVKSFDAIDTYIFPVKFTRDYYEKNFNLPLKKTVISPYFVPQLKKPINKRNSRYFLFIGRLSEEKGIIFLLRIFSTTPQCKLVVIGEGPLKEQVQEYKKYKNITIKKFIPRDEIFNYIQKALCTIIPSLWYEVLPLVLLESLASGTPVIVPKFGTFIEIVRENTTGIFYRQNDFEDLKEKILYAWENKDKMMQMGINARKEYERRYTPEKHYKALMKVYKKLVAS